MTDTRVGPSSLAAAIDAAVVDIEAQLIAWRRDLHANPELGNREFRTAGIVAAHLRALGFDEVRTEVAYTGVVGVLKGGRPGPVVALRAELPGVGLERGELIGEDQLGLVQESADERALAVVHAAAGDEPEHGLALVGVQVVLDIAVARGRRRGHQK